MAPETEPTAKRAELPMRLTRLRVKNFRSIADIDIPLSPLTVLVGPNGSGKSNVVDALRFVRDVFARGLDQAVMDREGMGVIQRWGTEGEGITIGITLRIKQNEEDYFEVDDEVFTRTITAPVSSVEYVFTIKELERGTVQISYQYIKVSVEQKMFPDIQIKRTGNAVMGKLGDEEWIHDLEKRAFLPLHASFPSLDIKLINLLGFSRPLFSEEVNDVFNFITPHSNNNQVRWWLRAEEIINDLDEYIGSTNFYSLNPTDLRQPQQLLKESPFDEKGRNMAAVLRHLVRNDGYGWNNLRYSLQQVVSGFNKIEIESVGGYLATKLIYQTDDSAHPRASYLGQESDGTIRMLGLLAALYQEPSQLFISIEEPEANIHPGALAVLAGVIDEASLRSQILVTTHSPDMLDHLPVESFLVVEKVGNTTHVGPLDASQVASVRKRLFTPSELFRMEGLQRQAEPEAAS